MENCDVRRRDLRHTPSPPQQQSQPPPSHPNQSDGFAHSASYIPPSSSNGAPDEDRHRLQRVASQAPLPTMRDLPREDAAAADDNRERRLRSEAAAADGGVDATASSVAAAASSVAVDSLTVAVSSTTTSAAVGHERHAGRTPPSERSSASSTRRRHHSGEAARVRGGVGGGRGDGNELGVDLSRRSPSLSPPTRRLQRELSLQPAQPDRNPIPRIASLTLSNQQWLGPSVQNSGRLNASGQPVPSSSSSLDPPPTHHLLQSSSSSATHQPSLLHAAPLTSSAPIAARATGQSGLVSSQLLRVGGGGSGSGSGGGGGVGGVGVGGAGARGGGQNNVYPDSSPEAKVSPLGGHSQPVSHSTFPEVASETETISNVASLNDRIAALWDQPELADVTLRVAGSRYPAHRLILATGSEVFRVMLLSSSWQDSRQPEIELEERSECLPFFADFLKYFYTSTILMTTDKAIPILFLADKYAVEDLRDSVVKFMIANIAQQSDTNRTISWYQYAKNCGHLELKNRCCEFIVWNMRVVIKSPDWINVDLDNLIEFLDYSDMVITDEFTLLKALEIWVRTNSCEDSYLDDDGRQIVRSVDVAPLADAAATAGPTGEDGASATAATTGKKSTAAKVSSDNFLKNKDVPSASDAANDDDVDDDDEDDEDISPPEPPQQVLDEQQQRLQQQQQREVAASPLPSARALLERVLPHVRFPMIKPEQLALLEEDAFVRKYLASFEAYMVNAYKYHAVPKEHRKGVAFLFGNNCTHFRNYTNRNISIHMQFDNYSQRSRSNFTWQFTTLASASNADAANKIKWEINFRPKGYSDYYNNNESTRFTLEIQNKEISLETDIAIFVLTRHQETNFVNLVTKSTFFFGGDSKVFKIENLLNLSELLKKECPMIIDDTLNLIVFVKAKS